MNYAKDLPIDKGGLPYPSPPAYQSNQSQRGVPLTSSVITFSDKTTVLDVAVLGGQSGNSLILGKWGTASVTATNFDWMVQSGEHKILVIPVSVGGINSVAGANVANGLFPAVAVITGTATSASIFTAEY